MSARTIIHCTILPLLRAAGLPWHLRQTLSGKWVLTIAEPGQRVGHGPFSMPVTESQGTARSAVEQR